ncbi:MAG: PilZ domain-containing protein [Candidatus Acidiferrales bacterium]
MDHTERRRSPRAKVARPLRVRPSEPRDVHFDETVTSANVSREGIYFLSRRENYYMGMRVFVTFPYTSPTDPMNCEYIGQVVRVEKLPNNKFGIAVHLGVTLNYGASSTASARIRA